MQTCHNAHMHAIHHFIWSLKLLTMISNTNTNSSFRRLAKTTSFSHQTEEMIFNPSKTCIPILLNVLYSMPKYLYHFQHTGAMDNGDSSIQRFHTINNNIWRVTYKFHVFTFEWFIWLVPILVRSHCELWIFANVNYYRLKW